MKQFLFWFKLARMAGSFFAFAMAIASMAMLVLSFASAANQLDQVIIAIVVGGLDMVVFLHHNRKPAQKDINRLCELAAIAFERLAPLTVNNMYRFDGHISRDSVVMTIDFGPDFPYTVNYHTKDRRIYTLVYGKEKGDIRNSTLYGWQVELALEYYKWLFKQKNWRIPG